MKKQHEVTPLNNSKLKNAERRAVIQRDSKLTPFPTLALSAICAPEAPH
jgi:hypothetical protein